MLDLIPQSLASRDSRCSPKAFTRRRKLPLPNLVVFLLFLVGGGKHAGVDGKAGAFFRQARRSDLWPDAQAVHRSAVTKARANLAWTAFEVLHQDAVRLAYDLWPTSKADTWRGLSVFAIDGSKYRLPASPALRAAFDPDSGLDQPGKGHYPECLVSTVYDVFRRLPIARTVQSIAQANERAEARALLPHIPAGGVLLFDRGYPSYDLIKALRQHYQGFWVIRCPATGTFPAVAAFARSGQIEALLTLQPPKAAPFTVRAVRLVSPKGECSVLLTSLFDTERFPTAEVVALYFRRWAVETHYRDEKNALNIETFHSETDNGIRQELFAILTVAVIARLLSALATDPDDPAGAEPQFKHAAMSLAQEAFLLTPQRPALALALFQDLLHEIARVRYYRPRKPRPAPPRLSKQPFNKWQIDRAKWRERA